MSESWDDYADGWDESPDVVNYSELAFESLCKVTELAGKSILDFGCGTGLLTEKMGTDAAEIVALDPSQGMIDVLMAKGLPKVEALCAELNRDLIETQRLAGRFDLVVASSVCAFVPDYQGTLELIKELLQPGGRFVQWDWPQTENEPDFGFTETMIEEAYRAAGLAVISTSRPFFLESNAGKMEVVMGVAGKNN